MLLDIPAECINTKDSRSLDSRAIDNARLRQLVVAAVGYADGYPRYIPSEGTPILVNGQQTQIIGRISMDMISIDLRPIVGPKLGADVTLWGKGLPVETIGEVC